MRGRRLRPILLPLGGAAVFLGIWYGWGQLLAGARRAEGLSPEQAEVIRRILLPYPHEVLGALRREADLIRVATGSTFLAALIGFLAAVAGGYAIAWALAVWRTFRQIFHPWILILQMTPVVILAPIIAIWIHHPPLAPVILVTFIIAFFPVVANAAMGLRSVDRNLRELFAVCEASPFQEMLYLRLPHSLPYLLTGMKVAATLAPIGAITGDIFVGSAQGTPGLGYLVLLYKQTADTPALFATAAMACLIGFVFVATVHLLHWWVLRRWHESLVRSEV